MYNYTRSSEKKGNLQLNLNKVTFRKSKKMLTTCKVCGHYRFAKRNSKRIINPHYPYEHASTGGCNVPPHRYVPRGQKLRKLCLCHYCEAAAALFDHKPLIQKKQRQYNYERTIDQEVVWAQLKRRGWYCRKGRYFCPGMKRGKYMGLLHEQVF